MCVCKKQKRNHDCGGNLCVTCCANSLSPQWKCSVGKHITARLNTDKYKEISAFINENMGKRVVWLEYYSDNSTHSNSKRGIWPKEWVTKDRKFTGECLIDNQDKQFFIYRIIKVYQPKQTPFDKM